MKWIVARMVKNLDRVPTSTFMVIIGMPITASIIGAKDVALVWTLVLWGLLVYLAVKNPE